MTSRQSSALPPPLGGDKGPGPVQVDSAAKGRGGFNGLESPGRLRTYIQEQANLSEGGKAMGLLLYLSALHPTVICPGER